MKQVSGEELCRLVQRKGWSLARVNGSHHIFFKPGSVTRLSIPVHGNKTLKLGLLRHLMKQAGLDEGDLND